jgi:hypothetical protein
LFLLPATIFGIGMGHANKVKQKPYSIRARFSPKLAAARPTETDE